MLISLSNSSISLTYFSLLSCPLLLFIPCLPLTQGQSGSSWGEGERDKRIENMKDGERMKGSLKEQKTKKGLARRWTGKLRC